MYLIDLNCDMGEGMPNDAAIMPFISSANIACGYHAGSKGTMERTIKLALQYRVAIGAHPGFADKARFGRTEQHLPDNALYDLIAEQLHIMDTACRSLEAHMTHIKPHGALYNMAARDEKMATIIASAVKDNYPNLCFYGLSNSWLIKAAAAAGLKTASEVFADRTYQNDGSLTPRSQPNALIDTDEKAIHQVLQMIMQRKVTSVDGISIPIEAHTVCLHGDGKHAVSFARVLHATLHNQNIIIQHP